MVCFLILCAFGIVSQKPLPNLELQRLISISSPKGFIVLAFDLGSIRSWLLCVVWRGTQSFACWLFVCLFACGYSWIPESFVEDDIPSPVTVEDRICPCSMTDESIRMSLPLQGAGEEGVITCLRPLEQCYKAEAEGLCATSSVNAIVFLCFYQVSGVLLNKYFWIWCKNFYWSPETFNDYLCWFWPA